MAARILAALAGLLVLFVVIGILLPGSVEVTRSASIQAPPAAVFPFLADLEAWSEWTPWGDVESTIEGSSTGVGATRVWDDPNLGSGALTLVEVVADSLVAYRVDVEDGAIVFEGSFHAKAAARGQATELTWTERVDLGWNPILGWTALTMGDTQGQQLEESLTRLRALFP